MYRPTVRYDDIYKKYVDNVFQSTTLDRNQIIRLALFAAPFSPLFNTQVKKYMTSLPPAPLWEVTDHGLWMEQSPINRGEERDVNEKDNSENERREREIYSEKRIFKNTGGIKYTLG